MKRLNQLKPLSTEKIKNNIRNGSNLLIKFFIPELDLDWEVLYYVLKEKKDSVKFNFKINKFKQKDKK